MIRLWTKQERNELWATCGVSPFDTPSHIYIRELGECRASCSYGFTGNRHGGPMGRRPIEAVIRWRLGPVSRAQFGTNCPSFGWEAALWPSCQIQVSRPLSYVSWPIGEPFNPREPKFCALIGRRVFTLDPWEPAFQLKFQHLMPKNGL